MKIVDLIVNVPEERVITLKLPEDISPGDHRVVIVIEEHAARTSRRPLFDTEGIWAGWAHGSTSEDHLVARSADGQRRF